MGTWCHCWVPLQGAILVCYGGGGEGNDQLWGSGCGAIAGCYCWVPLPAGCQFLFHINIFLLYSETTMNFVLNFLQTLRRSLHR